MQITYLNHAAFLIETQNKRIVIDPYDPSFTGMKWKDIEADVVCVTHQHEDHNYITGVTGNPYVIQTPGEYELGSIHIQGIQAYHDTKQGQEKGPMTLYVINSEDMVVGHFGNLGHELEEEQAEQLGSIDILLIPVDGVGSINAHSASAIVAQIDPFIVIPMHYKMVGTKTEEWGFAGVEEFLKEMGLEDMERKKSLSLKSKSALPEETEVVVLENSY